MLITTLWFHKIKAVADAIWCIICLFCVPGVIVAAGCMLVPTLDRVHGKYVQSLAAAKAKPGIYESRSAEAQTSNTRLGLFDRDGRLVQEYPDQAAASSGIRNGVIVIEIPKDIPSGEYNLRVLRNGDQVVRDIPLEVRGSK